MNYIHCVDNSSCSFEALRWKLYSCFEISGAYYTIDSVTGVLFCYTKDGILWGKLTAGHVVKLFSYDIQNNGYIYIWSIENASVEHYFIAEESDKKECLHDIIVGLNLIRSRHHTLAAEHGIYFK